MEESVGNRVIAEIARIDDTVYVMLVVFMKDRR